MDLLDRLLGHDVWSSRQLLLSASALNDGQLDQRFDLDNRTLRECFDHILENMEIWHDLMAGIPVRDDDAPDATSIPGMLARLSAAGAAFAVLAREIAREQRWDAVYTDVLDDPPTAKTYGGTIAHLITHSMHHRAQAMYMLERLGVREHIEGDVLSWEALGAGGQ